MSQELKDTTTLDLLRSSLKIGVMTYNIYDGSNRLIDTYEAPLNVKDQDPCLRTELKYVGTSQNVAAVRESVALWDTATYDYDNVP